MQIKSMMQYCYTPVGIAKREGKGREKNKRKTTPSIGENWEQLQCSHTSDGSVNWYNHFGNSFDTI